MVSLRSSRCLVDWCQSCSSKYDNASHDPHTHARLTLDVVIVEVVGFLFSGAHLCGSCCCTKPVVCRKANRKCCLLGDDEMTRPQIPAVAEWRLSKASRQGKARCDDDRGGGEASSAIWTRCVSVRDR